MSVVSALVQIEIELKIGLLLSPEQDRQYRGMPRPAQYQEF